MTKADGSFTVAVNVDNSKAAKELNDLEKKIEKAKKEVEEKGAERNAIAEELKAAKDEAVEAQNAVDKLKEALEESRAKTSFGAAGHQVNPQEYLAEMAAQSRLNAELAEQERLLAAAEKRAERLTAQDERALKALEKSEFSLNSMETRAGELTAELTSSGSATEYMAAAAAKAEQRMEKFTNRVKGLAKRMLVFSLITSALRGMKDWFGKVVKSNSEATAAIAKLKGALLTLAQPLVEVIVPALTVLVNVLTRVVSTIAQIVSMIAGKSTNASKKSAESLYKETEALEGVGAAADEASGSLAGFDEINTLQTEDSGGGSNSIAPDFDFDASLPENQLRNILELVKLIGSALMAWKISSAFGLGLKGTVGLFVAIYSAIELVRAVFDAWTNGVSWSNLLQMIAATAGVAGGLALAFGHVAAGISLIVAGLVMLVTGFHDAMENGWSFENVLLSIAGILAAGLGIALLTGSWIPLLIAAVAAVLLAITVATGHGEELLQGVRDVMEGFIDFFAGIFTGDIERATEGISKIVDGLKGIVLSVVAGVKDYILSFLDWLDDKTGGKFSGIINFLKETVSGLFDSVSETLGGIMDAFKQVLRGIIEFITGVFTCDWDKAWEGVKNIFKGVFNAIISILEGAVNLIVRGFNAIINAINRLIGDGLLSKGLSMLGLPGGKIPTISKLQLPRLAHGSVVPPNREFLAVLGDNKQETEVVSPLSTMRQAFLEAMRESGGSGQTIEVKLYLDGKQIARNQVKHINDMTQAAGKPVLLF